MVDNDIDEFVLWKYVKLQHKISFQQPRFLQQYKQKSDSLMPNYQNR